MGRPAGVIVILAGLAHCLPAAANVPGTAAQTLPPEVKQLLLRARDARLRGDLGVATLLLKNAAQEAPHNGIVEAELGNVLVMQGQTVQAERILRRARSSGGPDSTVLPALFQSMLAQHENQAVLEQFPEPGPRSPMAPEVLRARALAFFALGKLDEADTEIDKALAIRRAPPFLVNKAEFAVARGDLSAAETLTNEALKASPRDHTALIMKIGLLERAGDMPQALTFANRLVQASPNQALALVLRIEILGKLQRDREAQADVDKLLATSPNLPIGLYDKALLLARKGDVKGAWQIAQSLPPDFLHSSPQFELGFAKIAQAAGNSELSLAALNAVVSRFPHNEEARRALAQKRIDQHDFGGALELLKPVEASTDPQTLNMLAKAYRGLGQAKMAERYVGRLHAAPTPGNPSDSLMQSATADPGNPDAVASLVAKLITQGRTDEAKPVVDRFEKAAPQSPMNKFFRGEIAMSVGQLDQAAGDFSSLLRAKPGFVPALYYRAQVAAARGDFAGADADLDSILRSDPRNVQALSKKAEYAMQIGKDDQAAALLQRAAALTPGSLEPKLALGEFYLSRQKFAQGQAIAALAVQRFPKDPRATALLVRAYIGLNAIDRARAAADRLAKSEPQAAAAKLLLASVSEQARDSKGALASYSGAIGAEPSNPAPYQALISYYLRTGQAGKSVLVAKDLSRHVPGTASDLIFADALARAGKVAAARGVLEQSFSANPNSRTLVGLAALAPASGRKAIEKQLSDWIAQHDQDVTARSQLAALFSADGNVAAAKAQLERALQLQPYNPSVLNDLAWAVQKTDPARAIRLASLAARISPRSGEVLDTLAWLKWQQSDRKEGLNLLRHAHQLSPAQPAIAYHLAVALENSGDRASARNVLQVTLKSDADPADRAEARKLEASWH
jgi:putative PEP-CTERM system TPR-repeat lipoprotein